MTKTKKGKSKSRLDKWYHIAKEQGYRSRAAFKLIQLNRKYNFLNNANVLVDLCAAPGGWLQVATRYMPVSSIKIGVDLDSIKHVPGCITYQEDITTPKCLALIKKEIRNEKVDVVLNDGAPNVGANWRKDAFAQVELVLAALKLAASVLRRGGTFVTKVFRSADYNSLIWVLNKFFEKVEATKPAASRTQSAEIFIVCLRFIAPDYTDPKLFDAKFVFKDTEQDLLDASNQDVISLDKLLKPRKHREGYEDDVGVALFKSMPFGDFVKSENPLNVFARYNQIIITPTDQETLIPLVTPPEDYKEIIGDLKVQGKRELQVLLKWRAKVLRALGKQKKKDDSTSAIVPEGEEIDDAEAKLETDIEKEKRKQLKLLRKEKENKLNKAIKLKSLAPGAIENDEETEFDWGQKRSFDKLPFVDFDEDDDIVEIPIEKKKKKDERDVEENIELLYDLKKKSVANEERRRLARIEEKRRKKYGDETDENGYQLETIDGPNNEEIVEERQPAKRDIDIEDEDDEDDYEDVDGEDEGENLQRIKTVTQNALERSKWFDRDIFRQGIDSENPEGLATITNPMKLGNLRSQRRIREEPEEPLKSKGKGDKDDDFEDVEEEEVKNDAKKKDKLKIKSSMKGSEKRRQKIRQDSFLNDIDHMNQEEDHNKIEVVPALRYEDYDVDSLAEVRALAKKMLRKKDREEIMEDSYNRYSRPVDEDAPDWFREDEQRHSYKILPITKEEYAAEKQKLLEFKNRPIKKIAEAKIRKKFQVQKKLRKAQDRAKDIMEQEGVTEASKLKQVQNLYKKAIATKKVEKKYIVSKKFGDKSKGNRKTGRNTRMVDSRLKKDKRAQKRIEKRKGGPRTVKKSKKRQISRR